MTRRMAALSVVLGALSVVSPVAAQSVTLEQYRAAPTPDDGFALERPTDPGHLKASFGAHLTYALTPLSFVANAPPFDRVSLVEHQVSLQVVAALGLFDRFLAYVRLPTVLMMQGDVVAGSPVADGAGLGDLTFGARYVLHEEPEDLFRLALSLGVSAPTARAANEAQQLTGEAGAAFWPQIVAEVRPIEMLHITGTIGGRFREDANPPNLSVGHELTFGLGVGAELVPQYLEARLETFGSIGLTRFGEPGTTPWEVLLGARTRPVAGLQIGLAGGVGVTNGYGNPAFRGVLTVGYAFDGETTPSADASDEPEQVVIAPAEVPGSIRPDGTRVPTATAMAADRDVAPAPPPRAIVTEERPVRIPAAIAREAGRAAVVRHANPSGTDRSGTIETGDGPAAEPPAVRAAPVVPPDPRYRTQDRDGDRVVDALDLCPLDREDYDEIDDEDGCPEEDADDDGLADVDDHCPLTAGESTDDACGGCPARACMSQGGTIEIRDQVRFGVGTDEILEESAPVLRDILSILGTNAQILRVRIEGHTDSAGNNDANQELSMRRAQAVMAWLIEHGIHASRLEGWGCGELHPIDSNEQASGRTRNRRVEFIIVEPSSGRPLRSGCLRVRP